MGNTPEKFTNEGEMIQICTILREALGIKENMKEIITKCGGIYYKKL